MSHRPGRPKTRAQILGLADKFRQRAAAGWTTLLSPDTTMLISQALEEYAPKHPPLPARMPQPSRFDVDMYSSGSTIYKLTASGDILEIVAWAQNSLVARVAFDELVGRYPNDRFMQKRRSWVEREPHER